jgi:transcription elongation factor Elf1
MALFYSIAFVFLLWLIRPKFCCPRCGSKICSVISKDDYGGQERCCHICGHYGFAHEHDIKEKDKQLMKSK